MINKTYTITEIAMILRVGESTVWKHFKRWGLKPVPVSGKLIFAASSVTEMIWRYREVPPANQWAPTDIPSDMPDLMVQAEVAACLHYSIRGLQMQRDAWGLPTVRLLRTKPLYVKSDVMQFVAGAGKSV